MYRGNISDGPERASVKVKLTKERYNDTASEREKEHHRKDYLQKAGWLGNDLARRNY